MCSLLLYFVCLVPNSACGAEPIAVDVAVYGATPGGIAAALAAADDGDSVLLIEPTQRIGGMLTSGLSYSDFHAYEGLTGMFLDFADRVEAHYIRTYGKESAQAQASFRGTFGEPSVNLLVLHAMIAERKSIRVLPQTHLDGVTMDGKQRIASASFRSKRGEKCTVVASIYIDGSYEGDLMAAAGVPWRVGREGRDEYGESLAPPTADKELQAYNFRFIMTKNPSNRVLPTAPPGYRRDDFLPVVDVLKSGKIKTVFGYPSGCIFKAQKPALPNDKYDINDVSNGLIRLSLPGKNTDWPNGSRQDRERIFAEHLRDQVGLLYFLQTDPDVPEPFRTEAREWGFCKDEFPETNHLPPQLYVREARRMIGMYVFTQKDSTFATGDARTLLHRDAIAMGEYGNNCHGTGHIGPRFGGKHTGEFYNSVPPYQIPYGVIVPQKVENLLVPVAASSSHVGFCALRLEPIWSSLGQAAGYAAHLARIEKCAVQHVPIPRLQARLHRAGSATIYVGDVPPSHPDFAIVQWWGTLGGFHNLAPTPTGNPRGKNILGQYFETYPNHAAELEKILDATTAARWQKLAETWNIKPIELPGADGKRTRGEWLRHVARLAKR